ncbi:hypothetical protein B0H14DRAFT_1313499 [Mycena olivaceomarginata]|nr:hypothetical protein B0H14DRAFT_1313499 [Mycena olivaceomarginata]
MAQALELCLILRAVPFARSLILSRSSCSPSSPQLSISLPFFPLPSTTALYSIVRVSSCPHESIFGPLDRSRLFLPFLPRHLRLPFFPLPSTTALYSIVRVSSCPHESIFGPLDRSRLICWFSDPFRVIFPPSYNFPSPSSLPVRSCQFTWMVYSVLLSWRQFSWLCSRVFFYLVYRSS